MGSPPAETPAGFRLKPLEFSEIDGWTEDDHVAALTAFRHGVRAVGDHRPKRRATGIDPETLEAAIRDANDLGDASSAAARAFFESRFQPSEVLPDSGGAFFTAYYEPIVEGARTPSARYRWPIYARPDNLIEIDPDQPPAGLEPGTRFARQSGHTVTAYHDRRSIEAGCLAGRGLELVYLADRVDAFFIHIQGAARIRLAEGGEMRITYAAKSGHPYTPIGRVLIEMGALPPGGATMRTIRQWLADHPDEAGSVMARNRSFIFFREAAVDDPALGPIAAAKVPLTAGRSLAVDRLLHSFHTPVWIDTRYPDGAALRRLTVAQDTGSAIVGPARGDVFIGSGDDAGRIAGGFQAGGRFIVFVPLPADGKWSA